MTTRLPGLRQSPGRASRLLCAVCLCVVVLAACSSGPEPVAQPARYVVAPAPVYPLAALRAEETGRVILRVQVKADNSLGFVDVQTSSGSRRLDAAAVEAVKRATFASAKTASGKGVDSVLRVPITFKLE